MSVINLYRKDAQPFSQIPNEIIRDPEISSNAFRLLAYLMSHRDGYELTYDQIERQTGLGRFAINQAASQLKAKHWLDFDRPTLPNGRFGPKSWTVLDGTSVGHSTMEPHQVVQTTHLKKNTNKEEHYKEELHAQVKLERESLKSDFNAFWMLYPRKVAKQAAFKAFEKACKLHDASDVLAGVQRLARDPNKPSKQFLPHPATWLNEGRWEDEPYPERELTAEEKQARAAEDNARRREAEKRHNEAMRREMDEAKAKATPPPICVHGNKITSCRECLHDLSKAVN